MRTWWSRPATATVLLVLTCACQGPQPGASSTTSRAPTTSAAATTASPTSASPTGSPSTTAAGPSAPATTPAGRQPTPAPGMSRPRSIPSTPRPTTRTSPPTRTSAPGPSTLPAALRGRVVTTLPTSRRVVALTFDGGAGSQGAAAILATLRAQRVPASFFVTGTFATTNPAIVRQMAALGPVGNHSWSHPDFTTLAESGLDRELARTRAAIVAAGARDPRPFFRFPFGAYDARVLGLVNARGYGAIGWTTDSLGWKGTSGGLSADAVVSRVLAGRTPGQVVLMHVGANPDDGTTLDAAALPRVIAGYRAQGYGFVTLQMLAG